MLAYTFQVVQKAISDYLRSFAASTPPAICTLILVCGVRVSWVFAAFPTNPNFTFLISVCPITLVINISALIILYIYMFKPLKEKTAQIAMAH